MEPRALYPALVRNPRTTCAVATRFAPLIAAAEASLALRGDRSAAA